VPAGKKARAPKGSRPAEMTQNNVTGALRAILAAAGIKVQRIEIGTVGKIFIIPVGRSRGRQRQLPIPGRFGTRSHHRQNPEVIKQTDGADDLDRERAKICAVLKRIPFRQRAA